LDFTPIFFLVKRETGRKYFKFSLYFTGIFLQICGKLLALPVEKTVENFASVFEPLFRYFYNFRGKNNELCKTQKNCLKIFFQSEQKI
jgi:hypothetical protein